MKTISNKESRRVLVFNPLKRLIAVFQSVTAAAGAFNTSPTSIHLACVGTTISCSRLYFRHLDDKVEIELEEDLGKLRLEDYDKICGIKRKYYRTKIMNRTGMKYQSKKK